MVVRKYKILSNNLLVCDYGYIFKLILKSLKNKRVTLICPVATYALVKANSNSYLKKVLDEFYLIPDSQWVKSSINFLYEDKNALKMRATDLMLKILSLAERNKLRIFLYGTNKNTLGKLQLKLRNYFPNLAIAGAIPSKYRDLSDEEKQNVLLTIERSNTDIMFVGIGSPLQEVFSYELINKNPYFRKPIVIITAGAAFDFISGVKPQAPKLFQESGLEWLFRLILEPKRLWKRYLIFGPLFLILVLFQKINRLKSKNA